MANFNFCFVVECPECQSPFEISHFSIEVIHNGIELGLCPYCQRMVVAHLTQRALDGAKAPRKSKRATGSPRK